MEQRGRGAVSRRRSTHSRTTQWPGLYRLTAEVGSMLPFSPNTLPPSRIFAAPSIEEEAPSRTLALVPILSLLLVSTRPREWIKNVFVFAALFFSKNLFNIALLPRACLMFGLYCMVAGGVY